MIVRVRSYQVSGEDDFGRDIREWQERDWEVRGIAPGSMQEPDKTNRDLSVVMWTVYSQKGSGEPTSEHDQVRLPGSADWLPVEGRPQDWTLGPDRVGPTGRFPNEPPGIVVELRRADG